MTAQTNGERLLELARDLSAGFVDAEEQRELGRLLYDAALWPNNPLAKLSPVGAKQAREIDDSLELLRLLLDERSHLGQFRPAVELLVQKAKDGVTACRMYWGPTNPDATEKAAQKLAEAERLLALIGQRDAAPGVTNG